MGTKRYVTEYQKARAKAQNTANTSRKRRLRDWSVSRQAADRADFPINAHLTTHWGTEPCKEKNVETWRRLRICLNRLDTPWVAMRAPEHAPRKGHHMHTVFHVPDHEHAWRDVVAMIEEITGKVAAWVRPEGKDIGQWTKGVVAMSQDGSWMLQRNIPAIGTNKALIDYIAKQSGKEKAVGRHQRSKYLLAITRGSGAM